MQKKKTIMYVGSFELPDKNAAAHRVLSNAKIFRDLGYRVVLMDSCREQENEIEEKEDCFGFERIAVKKSLKQLYAVKSILNTIDKYDDVAAIIAYNYYAIGLNRLRKYGKKRNIKVIADITEWYGTSGRNIAYKTAIKLDSYFRMNVIQGKLDGVIAISRFFENFYKEKTATVFIPALTDLTEEKWNVLPENKNEDKLSIMYAGNPAGDKDRLSLILHTLLKVGEKDYLFKIIGIDEKRFLQLYPHDVDLLEKIKGKVEFLGRRSHVEVIKELKNSDFSLFYRDHNRMNTAGFPTKFAESITAGTPVLTNKTSDIAEFMVDGVNGIWIDDIEHDLKRVFDTDMKTLKGLKRSLDNSIFDYKKYVETAGEWFESIMSK